jgi:diguanylate cyclase (GGDEF)-like protein
MPKEDPWTDDKRPPLHKDNVFNRRADQLRNTAANMRAAMPAAQQSASQSLSQTYLRMAALQQQQQQQAAQQQSQAQPEVQHSYREGPPPTAYQAPLPNAPTQPTAEELERKAVFDSATMTFNLRSIMRMLQHELNRSQHYNRHLSVLMVELNGLKTIELSFGQVAYSLALSAAAIRLQETCSPVELVGRYSDSRFIVVCPERSPEDARLLAEHIRLSFKALSLHAQSQTVVPASIGFVSVAHGCTDIESLIAIADVGADTALERGENQICCAAEE